MNLRARSLKSKAIAVICVPLLVLCAATGWTFLVLKQSEGTQARVGHAYYVKERIIAVLDDLVDMETGVRGYLLTHQDEFLDPYWRGSSAIAEDLQYLQLSVQDEDADLDLLSLRVLAKRRLDILDRLRDRAEGAPTIGAVDAIPLLTRGRVVMEHIRALLAKMASQQQVKVDALRAEADRTRRVAFLVAVAIAPLGMLLALLVVLLFTGRTVRRLARMEENVRRLEVGEPMIDYDDGDDEIGRLGRSMVRSGTLAIELQEELALLARVDPLTALANRRGFMPLLEHQLALARRSGESVGLLFIDIDGLKSVNDTLGHLVGDEMIVETAALLRDTFRTSDVVARIGGDEFCVLLTTDSATATDTVVSRLESAVDMANRLPARPYRLSLSVGVAMFDPANPGSGDAMISEADRDMYEKKRANRAGAPLLGVRSS